MNDPIEQLRLKHHHDKSLPPEAAYHEMLLMARSLQKIPASDWEIYSERLKEAARQREIHIVELREQLRQERTANRKMQNSLAELQKQIHHQQPLFPEGAKTLADLRVIAAMQKIAVIQEHHANLLKLVPQLKALLDSLPPMLAAAPVSQSSTTRSKISGKTTGEQPFDHHEDQSEAATEEGEGHDSSTQAASTDGAAREVL